MKVYAAPEHITYKPDYRNYDRVAEQRREAEFIANVKDFLVENGFTGPYTGDVVSFPVADGSAQYVVGDKPRGGILIHLPFGDAYDFQYVERLSKSDIIKEAERGKAMKAMFASR